MHTHFIGFVMSRLIYIKAICDICDWIYDYIKKKGQFDRQFFFLSLTHKCYCDIFNWTKTKNKHPQCVDKQNVSTMAPLGRSRDAQAAIKLFKKGAILIPLLQILLRPHGLAMSLLVQCPETTLRKKNKHL